jgi:hypothetical protein
MIIVFGRRLFGKVGLSGNSYVRSQFAHLMFMPIIPIGSYLVVRSANGKEGFFKLPLHGASILAGYLRLWSLGAMVCAFGMMSQPDSLAVGSVIGALAVIVGMYAWGGTMRASAVEGKQRAVYADFAGAAVDVALIARSAGRGDEHATRWLADIKQRAQAAFASEAVNPQATYRDSARLAEWQQAADSAALLSPAAQRAALTLSRIAGAEKSADREAAAAAHAKFWSAIAAQPTVAAARAA